MGQTRNRKSSERHETAMQMCVLSLLCRRCIALQKCVRSKLIGSHKQSPSHDHLHAQNLYLAPATSKEVAIPSTAWEFSFALDRNERTTWKCLAIFFLASNFKIPAPLETKRFFPEQTGDTFWHKTIGAIRNTGIIF